MTLHTKDNLRRVLDQITSRPALGPAMRSIGASEKQIFTWLKRSNAGDPDFLIDWPEGDEPIQFVEAVALARKRHVALFEAQLRNEVTEGIPEVQIKDGAIVWELDRKWVGVSDDIMKLCGLDPVYHRYRRDKDGNAIPLVLATAAPAHLKIHVSRGLMPNLYGDHRTLDINAHHGGAVQVIHRRPVQQQVASPVRQAIEKAAIADDAADDDHVEAAPSVMPPDVTDSAPLDRPDIAELKRLVAERNAKLATPAPAQPGVYQTLAMRGDPRVAPVTRVADPDDHTGSGLDPHNVGGAIGHKVA
jgi:hypothetical protein